MLISACMKATNLPGTAARRDPDVQRDGQAEASSRRPQDKRLVKCFEKMSATVSHLQATVAAVTKERDSLKAENVQLQAKIDSLQEQLDNAKMNCNNCVSKALSGYFSSAQIESIVTQKPVSKWNGEDIAKAVTFRSLSPKAFRFIREKWKFPLPSSATISRWVSNLNVEPGVLQPVLNMLHHKCSTMSQNDRLCVISFDETSLSQDWSYDMGTDTLYDPKSKLQCVMLRGLTMSWKQIVYYNFDTNMKKDILFDIIQKVEAAGFHLVAMVSDLGSTNVSLWNSLGIHINNTSFTNPAASTRQIHVFADAPHLLKLVRNNFLDHGFTLDGNSKQTVTNGSVREIIIRSEHDIKTAHRLSHKHINVQGVKRMNVKLAAQLLSETTAKTIKFFGEQGLLKSKDWHDTSRFIALVDLWFDIFNSRAPIDKKQSRVAYGINLSEQNNTLQSMMSTIKNMKVGLKNTLYPFQKGILVSCQSLVKLYEYLSTNFGLKYIMTYRLNQDGLEHFFGYVRQMGASYQHPNAVQMKFRLRSYLLGKNCELVGSNYNTEKNNIDVSLSQMSFSYEHYAGESDITETESLESELMVSAMLFSCDTQFHVGNNEACDISFNVAEGCLEKCMEAEGLRYIGGFIARKFPQYDFLGQNVTPEDNTWIGEICRKDGKLMTPSDEFYEQVKIMERLFRIYHGEKLLKPGTDCMGNLSRLIGRHVRLPDKVIQYFVKCRVFFRMRNLNRNIADTSKKVQRKMKKLIHKKQI